MRSLHQRDYNTTKYNICIIIYIIRKGVQLSVSRNKDEKNLSQNVYNSICKGTQAYNRKCVHYCMSTTSKALTIYPVITTVYSFLKGIVGCPALKAMFTLHRSLHTCEGVAVIKTPRHTDFLYNSYYLPPPPH